jgi:hypothetical protein
LTLRTVAEIAAVLASAGLPVMVVGSAALAATVYPDLAQRPIVPPELVVADADAVTALQTLQSLGWRPEPASPHLLDAEFRAWVPGQRMVNAQAQALRIGWRVMPAAPCVELDATCWAVVVPLPLETATVTMLCPTDQLLYACLAASEGMLIALADVALLVRQTMIDWPRLLEIAGRYRLGLAVLAALETLVDVPGLAVPADALDALRRQPVSADRRVACSRLSPRRPARAPWWIVPGCCGCAINVCVSATAQAQACAAFPRSSATPTTYPACGKSRLIWRAVRSRVRRRTARHDSAFARYFKMISRPDVRRPI